MSNYPFSKLMPQNLPQLRDASLKMSFMTSKVSNNGDEEILGTVHGGATLADSSVVPSSRSRATSSSVTSRSQTKVAVRQLRKEGN